MILTTGCSFTYGEELDAPTNDAYPRLLANHLQMSLMNEGMMGASNDYIFRKTVQCCKYYRPSHVVVQWSETNRIELHANLPVNTPGRYKDYTGPLQTNIRWTNHGVDFIDQYYKNWWDEKFAFDKWIWQVIALQGFLESQGVEYVMFNAFGNQELIQKYYPEDDQFIDKNRFLGWPHEGFVEWVYGTPTKLKGHPGEEAHRIVADKLYEYFRT